MMIASERSEPRERSEPAKRRASERVGESEGRSPSVEEDSSSIGRAPVSKTGGWGFDSLLSCQIETRGRSARQARARAERSEPAKRRASEASLSERPKAGSAKEAHRSPKPGGGGSIPSCPA